MKKNTFKLYTLLTVATLLLSVLLAVFTSGTVRAATVTQFTNTSSITVDGSAYTPGMEVKQGQTLSVENKISFPDSQTINTGDTFVMELPSVLAFKTRLSFDVLNSEGIKVGTAVTNEPSGSVTVTFTDQFSKVPQNKRMSLQFNVTLATGNLIEGEQTFNLPGDSTTYTVTYKKDSGDIGAYEYKYGYQDPNDPNIIKWKIIINAGQDILKAPMITDKFGDNLILDGRVRVARYPFVPGVTTVKESDLAGLKALDAYAVNPTLNEAGQTIGFTVTALKDRGIWLTNESLFIEYATRITGDLPKGASVENTLSWSAANFPSERSINKAVRLETASGKADSDNTTMTPSSSSTSTTSPSTVSPSTSGVKSSTASSHSSSPSQLVSKSSSITGSNTSTPSQDPKKGGTAKKVLPSTGDNNKATMIVIGSALLTLPLFIFKKRNLKQ